MLSRILSCKPKKLSPGQKFFLQIGWKVDGSVLVLRPSQIGEIYFCSAEETVFCPTYKSQSITEPQDGRGIKLVAKPFKVFSGLQSLLSPSKSSQAFNFNPLSSKAPRSIFCVAEEVKCQSNGAKCFTAVLKQTSVLPFFCNCIGAKHSVAN